MNAGTHNAARQAMARALEAFESACAAGESPSIADYLPPQHDSFYVATLAELVRVDLECRYDRGQRPRLAQYQSAFPALFDSAEIADVAFEEFRLRALHGEAVRPDEYAADYGIDTSGWHVPSRTASPPPASRPNLEPRVGNQFAAFHLLAELGRGAFATVYLAKQTDLANRYVVLKISRQFRDESQTLAQLQHTNIVPVYSIHRESDWHAICMPFLGVTTLADVLQDIRSVANLPKSGQGLRSTLQAREWSTVKSKTGLTDVTDHPTDRPEMIDGVAPSSRAPLPSWDHLAPLSYVEAIAWLFMRIADGLAHAHERGVVHRDLKPANVLLRDDGEPLLLDFNLSAVGESASRAAIGGTLPYMAPEQIDALRECSPDVTVDARADLFALGIMMFELLTGQVPFPMSTATDDDQLAAMAASRRAGPPSLRSLNRQIPRAVESIVLRCLAPRPEDRYSSARELYEDLSDQLAHRPLRHAPERLTWERVGKWAHRHPRLSSASSLSAVAIAIVVLLGGMWLRARHDVAKHAAREQFAAFEADHLQATFHLDAANADRDDLTLGLARGEAALARYDAESNDNWAAQSQVALLPDLERQRLVVELDDLMQSMSAALRRQARLTRDETEQHRLTRQAGDLERRSRDVRAMTTLDNPDVRSIRDRLVTARAEYDQGRFPVAQETLAGALRDQPQNVRLWLLKGRGHEAQLQWEQAASCYTVCTVLRPDFTGAYIQRGVCRLQTRDARGAIADFDQALAIESRSLPALVNRALAHQQRSGWTAARTDLDRAVALAPDRVRLYFLRARVKQRMGDVSGAKLDQNEGMRRDPNDAEGFIARGVHRMASDPQGALADFTAALALQPRSFIALQNQAHVLSERLNRPDQAIEVLSRTTNMYPEFAPAVAGRGVLLARQGKRDAALADARQALALDSQGSTTYQVACIYALTSKVDPADATEALRLLESALRLGFGGEFVAKDSDLDPIRGHADFRRLLTLHKVAALQP